MAKTKNSDNIKKLVKMKKAAKLAGDFKVAAKFDIRLQKCYKRSKGKSLREWF